MRHLYRKRHSWWAILTPVHLGRRGFVLGDSSITQSGLPLLFQTRDEARAICAEFNADIADVGLMHPRLPKDRYMVERSYIYSIAKRL